MENQLKPNKKAFLVSRLIYKVSLLFIVCVVLFVVSKNMIPDLSVGVYILFFFLLATYIMYVLEMIVYKKLFFIFYENKIVQKGGSLFTSYETELNIKKALD